MKRTLLVIVVGVMLGACSSGKKTPAAQKGVSEININDNIQIDSADYYDNAYTITRMVDKRELQCQWNVQAMHHKQYMPADSLKGVFLNFIENEVSGSAPCGAISASYELSGNNIRIWNLQDSKQNCNKPGQENLYLDLLARKVKNLRIEGNRLFLLDGSNNLVFNCVKATR